MTFAGTGLSVDIVPVIEISTKPTHGWQYDIHNGTRNLTCAPCQIQFIRDRKAGHNAQHASQSERALRTFFLRQLLHP